MSEDNFAAGGYLPYVSAQLRASLVGIYAALQRIAPPERRCEDEELDRNAAQMLLCYYKLLRLAGNLSAADRFQHAEPLRLRNTDLFLLCQHLCLEAEALCEMCGVTLHFDADVERATLALDPDAMERLLLNLLSNALKFTPQGGSVRVQLKKPVGGFVRLCVTDTGCGIPSEQRDALFTPEPEDGSIPALGPHGLGLGLPLCRCIVMAHGGRIFVESAEGGGTCVSVSLPMKRVADNHLNDSCAVDYTGGFNHLLVELSDALPSAAFVQRLTD